MQVGGERPWCRGGGLGAGGEVFGTGLVYHN